MGSPAKDAPLRLADDVTFQAVGGSEDDTVVLSLKSGYLYTCNGVTASVLTALQEGQATLGELADRLMAIYDVDRPQLEADLAELADKLLDEELIVA